MMMLCTNGFVLHLLNIFQSASGPILKKEALQVSKELEIENSKHQMVDLINLKSTVQYFF